LNYEESSNEPFLADWRKRGLPLRLQVPLSEWLYKQHGFSLDMSLFAPRG
jgi:hypothetical protein